MFQVEWHLRQPTMDTIADHNDTTEITILITGSHRDSLTQGSMKDTARGTCTSSIPTNTLT